MRKKLQMRKSALQLISLDRCGRIDARSEIGSVIMIEEWLQRNTTKYYCPCDQVKDNEQVIPSYLLLTDQYMYILRNTEQSGKMVIKARRKLKMIMKITTKAKMTDVVKIQYGSKGTDGSVYITDTDRLHIPKKSAKVIKTIKSILQPSTLTAPPVPSGRRASDCGLESRSGLQPPPGLQHATSVPEDLMKLHSNPQNIQRHSAIVHATLTEQD